MDSLQGTVKSAPMPVKWNIQTAYRQESKYSFLVPVERRKSERKKPGVEEKNLIK